MCLAQNPIVKKQVLCFYSDVILSSMSRKLTAYTVSASQLASAKENLNFSFPLMKCALMFEA